MDQETFQLDSFSVTICDITDADLKALHALSLSVGWSHRSEDWAFMREVGRGLVALDESGRVHGSAMWFPFGAEFATVGMPRSKTYKPPPTSGSRTLRGSPSRSAAGG